MFRIYAEQTDNNNGVELYMGGNGFELGSRLKITQDSSDAIYDTIAMNLIHIMGNALMILYFRCDDNLRPDAALEDRVREDFGRLTNAQLEGKIQRVMLVDGFSIGRQSPLQPADRALLNVEMQHRRLPADRSGMVELAMQFWRGLEYREAAKRMAGIYVENDLAARIRAEQAATQEAALAINPSEFGFAPGVSILVVDLSHVKNPEMLKQISATFQDCRRC